VIKVFLLNSSSDIVQGLITKWRVLVGYLEQFTFWYSDIYDDVLVSQHLFLLGVMSQEP
jgi:hypothetical protein